MSKKKYKYGSNLDEYINNDFDNRSKIKRNNDNNVKLGRNEQCSCGSGLKYKKCCMKKNKKNKGYE